MTASKPAFSASISGWLSLATGNAMKLPGLYVYAATVALSPGRITLAASIAGATHAWI